MEQNSNIKGRERRVKCPAARRSCLCCGGSFVSDSPYLRVCELCKDSDEWRSGNVDIALHPRSPANDN